MSRTWLTAAERELFYEHTDPSNSDASATVLIEAVGRMLFARQSRERQLRAAVAVLADEWERVAGERSSYATRTLGEAAEDLRALLSESSDNE